MALATSLDEITQAVIDFITDNKITLGIADVFYGDQMLLPRTPAVCVEPESKEFGEPGPSRKVTLDFSVFILVYHSEVRSPQSNAKDALALAESIANLLHTNPKLKRTDNSDRVIHCMVKQVGNGYSSKDNTIVRSSRLTFSALSQEILPQV